MTRHKRPVVLAAALATLMVVGLSAPASAFVIMKSSGVHGDYGWLPADGATSPGARCGYSAAGSDGFAHFRWVRVRAPRIAARDVTPGRDTQLASWQVVIQRHVSGDSYWVKAAQSARQTRQTWDDQSGQFEPIKLHIHPAQVHSDSEFRAVIYMRWMRNGATEGTVKVRIEHYGVKWTVGTPDYVFEGACTGAAD